MTAERLAGMNLLFSDDEAGEESFQASFLSNMKLKHLFPVETRRRWMVIGSLLYVLYCGSGLLWISSIQHEPHLQHEIQVWFFNILFFELLFSNSPFVGVVDLKPAPSLKCCFFYYFHKYLKIIHYLFYFVIYRVSLLV